jgi:serine phosphatase RsbU (regulator of sigma subunit)
MGQDWVRVFLADATGHGVQAALRAMVVKTMYDSVCTSAREPGAVLGEVNRALVDAYPDLEAKVDAACVDIVEERGAFTLRAAQAGGVAIGVLFGGVLDEVRCPGLPLGVGSSSAYRAVARSIGRGARVILVSDGILDQQDSAGKLFEWDGLAGTFGSPRAGGGLEDAVGALRTAWSRHRGDIPQDDDATLAVIAPTRRS